MNISRPLPWASASREELSEVLSALGTEQHIAQGVSALVWGWGLRFYASNKVPDDVGVEVQGPYLGMETPLCPSCVGHRQVLATFLETPKG